MRSLRTQLLRNAGGTLTLQNVRSATRTHPLEIEGVALRYINVRAGPTERTRQRLLLGLYALRRLYTVH